MSVLRDSTGLRVSATSGTRGTPSDSRSTAKARGAHDPKVKAEVLRRLRADASLAAEHQRTGIAKGTLSRWARDDGIDLGASAKARTANASAAVQAKAAEVAVTTTSRLEGILDAELATHAERTRLEHALTLELGRALAGELEARGEVFRLMRGESAATVMLRDPDSYLAQLVAALELLNLTTPKRDTVGAWTRAVHDLALLRGEATERGAILVNFGTFPRPDTSVVPIPESELNG